jgi:hypothetical protein
MPAPQLSDLGPLGALAGIWEGSKGLDVSFHNAEGEVADTPYRERVVMNAFGPVDNGEQQLFGLDYRMAAWRGSEEDPFHTEVGYWLWDATNKQVMRCFMVPRGSVLIAGATVEPDARTFTLAAVDGAPDYGILSNKHLLVAARTTAYEVTITIGDDEWSYDETTHVTVARLGRSMAHTDRNTLRRVAE